ncbi:MAG: ChaN family lipoprotein [Gemmatimonadota bacterium]
MRTAADTTRPPPKPTDALAAIVTAFASHDAVLLGESHYSIAEHRFIHRLLHDRRLLAGVNDIAVEFANSRYQPLIDRYISGERVPGDSLRQIWENTIVLTAWEYPMYANFFVTMRAINATLPRAKRLRVLALDPPIPWDSVRSTEDIPRKWGYRGPAWFEVLEREVFNKHRKVLVICGGVHILRADPKSGGEPTPMDRAGLGDALEQRYPGRSYAVYPIIGRGGAGEMVRDWPVNSLADIHGTTLGARNSHILLPGNVVVFRMVDGKRVTRQLTDADFPPMERMVDALVYFGPDTSVAKRVISSYRSPEYVAELHRRSAIVQPMFGQDLDPMIDSLAAEACAKKCARKK